MTATPLAIQSLYNQNRNVTPSSPYNNTTGTSTTSPYLPGYLLGGTTSSPSSANYGRSLSSGGFTRNHSNSKLSSRSPPHSSLGSPYTSPPDRKQQRMLLSSNQQIRDKPGAPPTQSLHSATSGTLNIMEMETDTPRRSAGLFSTPIPNDTFLTPQQSPDKGLDISVFSPHQAIIPQSPAQIDPFYSEGDVIKSSDILDHTAVTVFGFPPAASSYILQQFAQYGAIEKHEIHNTGNWLHIKYQTKIQAKKALSKNGKIFSRSIMIGVVPCIRKEIAGMQAEFDMTQLNQTPRDFARTKMSTTMRPLSSTSGTTPLRNASVVEDLLNNDSRTPQKKESVVSKALDYVFGW